MTKGWVIALFVSCLFITHHAYARKAIHGCVTDAETGDALPVAHIQVVGTRTGTITNTEGNYFLELKTLPATIQISYIGYHSQRITVTSDSPAELNIALIPSPIVLEEIVVSGEDPAIRIMREVIRRKQLWRVNLETYEADAYTRVTLANDSTIASISESISEIFWDKEQGHEEVIKSKRQTKNTKPNQNFASARMTPNLYDDDIDIIGFNVIGPTHPEALKHYDFKLIKQRKLDDKIVFDISVKPQSKLQPTLVGSVSVLDEEYAMIAIDVKPCEAIMFPPPLNNFNISLAQQFSNFGQEFWLPVDVRVSGDIKLKLPGLEFPTIKYTQLTRLSDYNVNVSLPDSLFDRKKKITSVTVSNESVSVETKVEETAGVDTKTDEAGVSDNDANIEKSEVETFAAEDAVTNDDTIDSHSTSGITVSVESTDNTKVQDKAVTEDTDSLFARNSQVIPLTDRENKAYSTIDSTMTMEKAFKPKGFLTRFIKEDNPGKPKKQSKFNKVFSRFSDFSPHAWHNRVDGYHLGLKYRKKISKRFSGELTGAYKTGQERWSYGGNVKYLLGKKMRGFISLNYMTGTEPRYLSTTYPVFLNSILTLSGTSDYFDYFWNNKRRAVLGYYISKIKSNVSIGINGEHHTSLRKSTDYNLLGRNRKLRENPSVNEGWMRSVDMSIVYGDTGNQFGVVSQKGAKINIEHSSPDFLSSDFSFTRFQLVAYWGTQTFLKRRLLPNTLDVKFVAGTADGKLPVQRFGAVDGSFIGFSPFGVFRTLRNHPLEGERHCALFLEHNFRTVPFELLGLQALAKRGLGIIVHGATGRTWISKKRLELMPYSPYYHDGFINEVGFSLNSLFGYFRLDVTKRLDKRGVSLGWGIARIF